MVLTKDSTKKSVTTKGHKFVWSLPEDNADKAIQISSKFGLSLPVSSVLAARGIDDVDQVAKFLFSDVDRDVSCPSGLKDAKKAVERIEQAVKNKEKILVFGDYDVDGMTSSAIVMLSLLPLGADVNYFLPHREKDGYGITATAVEKAKKYDYSLIITVDNGTTAHSAADKAKELGIDLIITDHHQPKEELPEVFALINPHQDACPYPNKNFCGAGVIFKIMALIYKHRGLTLPEKIYELLMMGTVADMVPMDLENRYWVRHGLTGLKRQMSYSFFCMAKNSNLNPDKEFWSAQDIGFCIAPQLNALGRLDNPRDAVQFLISSDKNLVEDVAQRLKDINDRRKKIDRAIFSQIDDQIKKGKINLEDEKVIMAADSGWPPGVIGLVAGKLMAGYGRPTFLFHLTTDGLAKGSCRSIEQFNVFKALDKTKDLLISFGGHSCAAGLSLKAENLPELKKRLEEMVSSQVDAADLQPKLVIDSELALPEVDRKLLHDIRMLEPFGSGNSVPVFLAREVVLVRRPELLKDLHVKCMVFSQGTIKPVIFFNKPELHELFLANQDKPFDLAVNVSGNEWNGRTSVDFIGLDVRFAAQD